MYKTKLLRNFSNKPTSHIYLSTSFKVKSKPKHSRCTKALAGKDVRSKWAAKGFI